MAKYTIRVNHHYFEGGEFEVEAEDEDEAGHLAKALAEEAFTSPELVDVEWAVEEVVP